MVEADCTTRRCYIPNLRDQGLVDTYKRVDIEAWENTEQGSKLETGDFLTSV